MMVNSNVAVPPADALGGVRDRFDLEVRPLGVRNQDNQIVDARVVRQLAVFIERSSRVRFHEDLIGTLDVRGNRQEFGAGVGGTCWQTTSVRERSQLDGLTRGLTGWSHVDAIRP